MDASPLDLLGAWALDRRVEDRAHAQSLSLQGTALLTAADHSTVLWEEEGLLIRGDGSRSPASRTLRIQRRGNEWSVLFADGRDFHPWTPGTPVLHPCGADAYRGLITVDSVSSWRVRWEVSGPDKDYVMCSELIRQPAAGHASDRPPTDAAAMTRPLPSAL